MTIWKLRRRHAALLVALALGLASQSTGRAQELPFDPETGPRPASADDIRIMEPYIGTFRSPTTANEQFGEPTFYEVTYEWVDEGQTSVAVRVTTVGDESSTVHSFLKGFYGFDPVDERLFAAAVFSWGGAGIADLGEFDHATGRRVVHARALGPEGTVIHIRDVFDVIDADRWRDRTYTRVGDEGEWKQVYEDVFTRVK